MEETGEHLDPTVEVNLDVIKKRAIKGIAVLTGRTFLLNIITLVAQGLLWAFISPADFGVFILVSATINFLSYFADIGLGAALIQKKEKPQERDFKTVFAVQEILVVTIVLIVFLISPFLTRVNHLSKEAVYLLYALNISFFLASLKNIPSIILERRLNFAKFVIPQVVENVTYNAILVYLAWRGFGISSFTYAVLARGIIGVIAIYLIQPWKPGFQISKESLKDLLKFGIPYQLNNFLATVKDDGLTIVVGGILGTYGLGILGTAQKLAQYPLRFFMDNVTKVTFPAFSRMQDEREALTRSLNRSILFIALLVFPSLVGLISLFPMIITVVPKYQKWAPAFIPLIFLAINSSLASVTTQLTNLLTSVGRIKTTLKLMVMWTALSWLLLPLLSKRWGVDGTALGYAIVGSSAFIVFYLVKRFLNWSVFDAAGKPLIASVVMGIYLYFLGKQISANVFNLVFLVVTGGLLYALTAYLLIGKSLLDDVKKSIRAFIGK